MRLFLPGHTPEILGIKFPNTHAWENAVRYPGWLLAVSIYTSQERTETARTQENASRAGSQGVFGRHRGRLQRGLAGRQSACSGEEESLLGLVMSDHHLYIPCRFLPRCESKSTYWGYITRLSEPIAGHASVVHTQLFRVIDVFSEL